MLPFARGGRANTPGACLLQAEQKIGPYYLDKGLLRADIIERKAGLSLRLRLAVRDARSCKPLERAAIDLWHCDALGLYCGYTAAAPMSPAHAGPPSGGPPPGAHRDRRRPTVCAAYSSPLPTAWPHSTRSCRAATPGCTNRIHFKVRIDGHAETNLCKAGHVSHVGQISPRMS